MLLSFFASFVSQIDFRWSHLACQDFSSCLHSWFLIAMFVSLSGESVRDVGHGGDARVDAQVRVALLRSLHRRLAGGTSRVSTAQSHPPPRSDRLPRRLLSGPSFSTFQEFKSIAVKMS